MCGGKQQVGDGSVVSRRRTKGCQCPESGYQGDFIRVACTKEGEGDTGGARGEGAVG